MQRRWKRYAFAVVGSLLFAAGGAAAQAESADFDLTPPRLSFLSGDVWTWRPGDADWGPAQKNLPLARGDRFYSGTESRFEIQIGAGAFVRGGSGTEIGVDELKSDFLRLEVASGTISLDARDLGIGQVIEAKTTQAEFRMDRAGYYRLDVGPSTVRLTTRTGGLATVKLPSGKLAVAGSGTQLVIDQGLAAPVVSETVDAPDDWDNWNYGRTSGQLDAESARYVSREMYGLRDLDDYGNWRHDPVYGHVWVPAHVHVSWAPYSTGNWIWDPHYGWTWLDDAPWGWAPFHYGRWVYLDSFWAWAPGPPILAPVYAPALVAFFGSGHVRVGLGFSSISWVALGWGEPLIPWWGPPRYVGRPCWKGWGGPRRVNRRPVHHGHHPHAKDVKDYDNGHVRDAVRHQPGDRFGRDRANRSRPPGDGLRDAKPLRGNLPMQPPGRSSSVRNARTRVPPPERLHGRAEERTRRPAHAAAPPRPSADAPQRASRPMEAAPPKAERRYPGDRSPAARGTARDRQQLTATRRNAPPPPPDSDLSARPGNLSPDKRATRLDPRQRTAPERLRDRTTRRAAPERQAPPPPTDTNTRSSATAKRGVERQPSFERPRGNVYEASRPGAPGAVERSEPREKRSRSVGSRPRSRQLEPSKDRSSPRGWARRPERGPSRTDPASPSTRSQRRRQADSSEGSNTARTRSSPRGGNRGTGNKPGR